MHGRMKQNSAPGWKPGNCLLIEVAHSFDSLLNNSRLPMTTPTVQFMFDFGSPNAYLCHKVIPAVEGRTGIRFEYIPVLLGGLFKLANNRSPGKARRTYRKSGLMRSLKYSDLLADTNWTNSGSIRFFLSTH